MTPIIAQGPPHPPPGRGPWDPYHPGQGHPPPFDGPIIPEPSSVTIILAFLILFILIRLSKNQKK